MDPQPLDFEKPIFELKRRLQDLKEHSDEHESIFDSEVEAIEAKIAKRGARFTVNLTAWQRVQIARHVQRPFALDYIERCFTGWVELHGDRIFADDKAMPCGLARLGPQRCVVITHQKGRNTKENVMRNFGCAHPEGYRKALRLMRLAEKFGMPVISLIDTPGAYPGIGSEERHISEAIAVNLREMMNLQRAHCRRSDRRRRLGRRAGYRRGRSRPDYGERLLLCDQPGSLFRHLVARPESRRRGGRSVEIDRTGPAQTRTWSMKLCLSRKMARIATTNRHPQISARRFVRILTAS